MKFYYEILKKKYERLYNKKIEKNKNILLESFVEYYGEQHRDEIINRFNEITFVYYINCETFDKVLMSNKGQKTAKFKDLRKILNYLSKKSKDIFQDSFIGFSNNLNDELLLALFGKETLTMIIDRGNPICFSFHMII